MSILIVEDDDSIRESLADFLESAGYRVVTARDGKEAVDHVVLGHNDPPCLILLDLMMPTMNGSQFLAARRVATRLQEIPVVIVSAWLNRVPEDLTGVVELLSKPIDREKLLSIIRRHCGGSLPTKTAGDSPKRTPGANV